MPMELQSLVFGGVIPTAQKRSSFEIHRRALLPTALLFHTAAIGLPFLMTAPGLLIGWLPGAALGSLIGLGITFSMLNRGALIGNARLERRLRNKLMAFTDRLEFVGVCELENNTLEQRVRRFETDDNVGLLALTDEKLVVLMEEGRIELHRDEVSSVTLEPLPDYPRLSWVRIEFDRGEDRQGFLLMSRDARNLEEIHERTDKLYRRLVQWHVESQLAWLEKSRRHDADTDDP
jgi:hypothetical protein